MTSPSPAHRAPRAAAAAPAHAAGAGATPLEHAASGWPAQSLLEACEDLDDAIAVLSPDGRPVASNRAWRELLRVLPAQTRGEERVLAQVLGDARLQACLAELEARGGGWFDQPWPDGRVLRCRFAPMPGERTLCVLADVTRAREREAALREEADRFRAYAEVSGDWLWEVDRDLRYSHVATSGRDCDLESTRRLAGTPFGDWLSGVAVDASEARTVLRGLKAHQPFRELEVRVRDAGGGERTISFSASPFSGPDGTFQGFRGIARNVTEARELASRLAYQASHDDLTGLANRRALEQRIGRLMEQRGDDGAEHALCFLDMDQIKVVNDTCGHAAGDALLNRVARLLREGLRDADLVARMGGDEFAVLLRDCNPDRALSIARKIQEAIRKRPFAWEGQEFRITTSIGVAPLGMDMSDAADVMRAADSACYAAKEAGRDRVKLYALDDSTLNIRQGEMHWVARIHRALSEKRFELFVQPIAPTRPGADDYLHFEALLRLNGTDGRVFTPGAFLPAAERYNLASQIDSWVLDEALAWLGRSPLFLDHLQLLSVNLSGQSLGEPAFRAHVRERVRQFPHAARKLCFEITETAAISQLDPVQEFMTAMREFGCCFALDDFGAGLSSFAYLRTLDVDYLKIDGMFVQDLTDDPIHVAMVRSINEVGHVMGKKTIAEFVEDDATREKLAEIGVDMVQGYAIGKPVPFAEVV